MREFIEVKRRQQAVRRATWAVVIVKCDGGYMAFEFVSDADTWGNQK